LYYRTYCETFYPRRRTKQQHYGTTLYFYIQINIERQRPTVSRSSDFRQAMASSATTENDDADSKEIPAARAAARGTLVTLLLRLISFACTQWTFRVLDPSTLGKANIQLELLLTTVLFVSREGFRLSLTRNIAPENWSVAWLTIPLVTVVACGALAWHLHVSSDADYRMAGILYCLASWIEGCAEPAVLYCLRRMDVPTRASAEGLATVGKTLATVLALRHMLQESPVTAFGISQLVYACIYTSFLYWKTWSVLTFPSWSSFDRPTCSLTVIFTLQGFFKHLLTEADRIVLATVSDSYDQGVYAMGSSYGGMAARILLQPLEENARLLWSRLAQSTKELEESYTVLVKLVLYIGLLFSCVAVNYTSVLLNVLAGRKWGANAEAAAVLGAFCIYTSFLAANGMTEAFLYAVTTSGVEVGRLGVAHTVTGVVFATAAPLLVARYGTVGLVAANCVAMLMRSIYSIHFAARYFGQRQGSHSSVPVPKSMMRRLLQKMIPHPIVLGCFLGAYFVTRWSRGLTEGVAFDIHSKEWLLLTGQHVASGVSCVVGIASVAYALEVEFKRSLVTMVRPKRD
jgi:oligosaccharide translocation protein RFT1